MGARFGLLWSQDASDCTGHRRSRTRDRPFPTAACSTPRYLALPSCATVALHRDCRSLFYISIAEKMAACRVASRLTRPRIEICRR
jgi:hypothetical protein